MWRLRRIRVNPTTIGHHAQPVGLYDGPKELAVARGDIFVGSVAKRTAGFLVKQTGNAAMHTG